MTYTIFLSYNIQFVCEYYRIEKQDRFCMLSMQKKINYETAAESLEEEGMGSMISF